MGCLAGSLGAMSAFSKEAVVASISPQELVEFENQPEKIRELISSALELTDRKLGYQFGSSSPKQGGMDCSGTVYHTLSLLGIEIPRSSRGQYDWVKEIGGVVEIDRSVTTLSDSRFSTLRPGDLLFWKGTYDQGDGGNSISHVMIYLGTLKADGKAVIFGASSGRRFRGKKIHGVSVFDFALPKAGSTSRFVGFSSIPGLR